VSLFAQKKFDKIALISSDKAHLAQGQETILISAEAAGRIVEVETWNIYITNTAAFKAVLKDTKSFANITCVLFNAARAEPN
jgi:hypothetical protein